MTQPIFISDPVHEAIFTISVKATVLSALIAGIDTGAGKRADKITRRIAKISDDHKFNLSEAELKAEAQRAIKSTDKLLSLAEKICGIGEPRTWQGKINQITFDRMAVNLNEIRTARKGLEGVAHVGWPLHRGVSRAIDYVSSAVGVGVGGGTALGLALQRESDPRIIAAVTGCVLGCTFVASRFGLKTIAHKLGLEKDIYDSLNR